MSGGVTGVVKSVEITLMVMVWSAPVVFVMSTVALVSFDGSPPGEFDRAPRNVIDKGGPPTLGHKTDGLGPPTGPQTTDGPPPIE